jgi:phage FluMu protein Com
MPIEFRCTKCNRLLRTPDGSVGFEARCPECGATVIVPSESTAGPESTSDTAGSYGPPPPPPSPPGSPFGSAASGQAGSPFGAPSGMPAGDPTNPYASPAYAGSEMAYAGPAGPLVPTTIDFGDILHRTWEIFKRSWGPVLVAAIILYAVNFVGQLAAGFIGELVAQNNEDIAAVIGGVAGLATTVVSIWLQIGLRIYLLKTARAEAAEFSDLFSGGPYFWRVLGASILFGLMVGVGMLLLIVPGVILALMFWPYAYVIVDRNVGVMESFQAAQDITKGNRLTVLAIYLVCGIASVPIVLLTCGLGLLAVVPFWMLLIPVMYLAATGQPTADQRWAMGYQPA